ncbi:monovalent cation/H(+) antiporter subunit G [Cecembia sp.]|uniref:cation:proton antiporter n=1 Tax=Cecembia sp. TaxID=1898110 RepID=UPI0025C08F18|nr:monovalent cation/H(+) antiporter subunit G [Cecembia sp.]
MMIKELLIVLLLLAGCFFFLAGTLGLLRFPDLFSRLHALTNADNLGLGFIAAGMALYIASPWTSVKIFLIWILTLLSSATSSYLIARFQRGQDKSKNRREE